MATNDNNEKTSGIQFPDFTEMLNLKKRLESKKNSLKALSATKTDLKNELMSLGADVRDFRDNNAIQI